MDTILLVEPQITEGVSQLAQVRMRALRRSVCHVNALPWPTLPCLALPWPLTHQPLPMTYMPSLVWTGFLTSPARP